MKDNSYGHIQINLDDLLKERGLNKNKFSHHAEMQYTQITRYCKNDITRLDTAVLSRICYILKCEIDDLLTYIPPENDL